MAQIPRPYRTDSSRITTHQQRPPNPATVRGFLLATGSAWGTTGRDRHRAAVLVLTTLCRAPPMAGDVPSSATIGGELTLAELQNCITKKNGLALSVVMQFCTLWYSPPNCRTGAELPTSYHWRSYTSSACPRGIALTLWSVSRTLSASCQCLKFIGVPSAS